MSQPTSEEDVLIVWDYQNVRMPKELSTRALMEHLHATFVVSGGKHRRCRGCVSSFTDATKKAVGNAVLNELTNNGIMNVSMLYSRGGGFQKSADADHPLQEAMCTFAVDCLMAKRRGVIVLITGDADFVRTAVWCRMQGCIELNLLYYGGNVAKDILGLSVKYSMEWVDFLNLIDQPHSGKTASTKVQWTFNYPNTRSSAPPTISSQHIPTSSHPAPTQSKQTTAGPPCADLLGFSSAIMEADLIALDDPFFVVASRPAECSSWLKKSARYGVCAMCIAIGAHISFHVSKKLIRFIVSRGASSSRR